jgi:hypothetical protein
MCVCEEGGAREQPRVRLLLPAALNVTVCAGSTYEAFKLHKQHNTALRCFLCYTGCTTIAQSTVECVQERKAVTAHTCCAPCGSLHACLARAVTDRSSSGLAAQQAHSHLQRSRPRCLRAAPGLQRS